MNNIEMLKQFLRERYPKQWAHRHFAYVFAEQGIASCVNYATTILFINALGLEEYGRYGLILAFVGFFIALHNSLVLTPMSSLLPQLDASKKPAAAHGWVIKHVVYVVGALIMMLGVVGLLGLYNPSWIIASHLLPISFLLVSYLVQEFIRRYFLIEAMYKEMLFYSVISHVTQLVALLYFLLNGGLSLNLILFVISFTSFAAILYALLKTTLFHPKHYPFEELMLLEGVRIGSWYTLSSFLGLLGVQISLLLTGSVLGLPLLGALTAIGNCFLGLNVTIVSFGNYRMSKITPIAKNYHPIQLLNLIFKQNKIFLWVLTIQLFVTGFMGQGFILHQLLSVLDMSTILFLLMGQALVTLVGAWLGPVDVLNQILLNAKSPSLVRVIYSMFSLILLVILLKTVGVYAPLFNNLLAVVLVNSFLYAQFHRKYGRETRTIGELLRAQE